MIKIHNLKNVDISGNEFTFHYQRIQCDKCGNSRFRVWIIDPDTAAVYEIIFKCYESQIPERVRAFVETAETEA